MGPVVKGDEGNFDALYRAAFERFFLDLIRGAAAEEERMDLVHEGKPPTILIKDIQLKGEYPKTSLIITAYDRIQDRNVETFGRIWQEPSFFDEDYKPKCDIRRMVGDTLMWARGG